MFHENHWIKKDKASRQNPNPWINPSLSSQDISHNLLQQNARSVLAHRDERKSQKRKTYGKNVYRFSIPKLIAESFSATLIFFHTSEN